MTRHFTTSIYIYDKQEKKFLFIKHKLLNKWLQPGGHIEENELPDDCAKREVFEETGLRVKLIGERLPRQTDQTRPYGIQTNWIEPKQEEALDLIYLAEPVGEKTLVKNTKETDGIGWFSLAEILQDSFDTFPEQRQWCQFFSELLA